MIDSFEGKYAFLSNFAPSPVHEEPSQGEIIDYPTVEHYFQAMKTKDLDIRREIAAASTPGEAKRIGRHVDLRPDWNAIKTDVMLEGVRGKFRWIDLRELLLETGDEELEEGNTWHDNIWGNCHCPKCKNIPGENRLGKILMQVREEIKSGNCEPVYRDS